MYENFALRTDRLAVDTADFMGPDSRLSGSKKVVYKKVLLKNQDFSTNY